MWPPSCFMIRRRSSRRVGYPPSIPGREYPAWVVHSLMAPHVMCRAMKARPTKAAEAMVLNVLAACRRRRP